MKFQLLAFLSLIGASIAFIRAWIDHKRYLKQLTQMDREVREARRALERRGELANEIAHEIKNPLTAILCSAETLDLILGPKLSEDHRKSLRYIREYGDNILRLVSDFLDVSRAESGKLKASPEPTEIMPLVQSIAGLLESGTITKKLDLRCQCVCENATALIDPRHLKQIVFNLLHNAIKFTPSGGEIQVIIRSDFPRPNLIIVIQDTGIGIPESEMENVFDPYTRSSLVEAEASSGIGLGLPLCKALVQLAGGSIKVTSQVGVGTSFEISIPEYIERDEKSVVSVAKADLHQGSGLEQPLLGQRFLVVDGDSAKRDSVASLLQAWGGMVDAVSQAEDALRALSLGHYDAVMVDHGEDGQDATQISKILRDRVEDQGTALILATDQRVEEQSLRDSGADFSLEKPFDGKAILKALSATQKLV